MKKSEEEKLRTQLLILREKRIKDKKKYNKLISEITHRKREILKELDEMKERVKDILYVGDIK